MTGAKLLWHSNQATQSRRKVRRGASAVEFAIVAPVFFLLAFGLVEIGRMVMVQQSMTNAARAGCRMAILATTSNESEVRAAVDAHLNAAMIDNSVVTCDVNPTNLFGIEPGSQVTVTVAVDFSDVGWLPLGSLNPTISAKAVQRRE